MTPILGEPSTTPEVAACWAASKGAPFWWCHLAPLWFELADAVRPEVAFVQACKETGFGKFGRAVTKAHHNVCGAKIPDPGQLADDSPEAHQVFPHWRAGILAQLDHLALYAGAPSYPRTYNQTAGARGWLGATWDPRHFAYLLGTAPTVEQLGGKWAPAANYGDTIVASVNELIGYGWG